MAFERTALHSTPLLILLMKYNLIAKKTIKKAFDTVDHDDILMYKLEHYGIRGVANSWICSYPKNRRQTVQVGPYISKKN